MLVVVFVVVGFVLVFVVVFVVLVLVLVLALVLESFCRKAMIVLDWLSRKVNILNRIRQSSLVSS